MLDGAPSFEWHHEVAADSVMPPRSTPLEHVLDIQEARLLDIPVPIAELWDPDKCPEHLLPYLAWALSVDLWRDDWPIERRRYVCRESLTLHRLKGTLGGIKRHLRLVDTPLKRAIVPPDTFFPSRGYSAAERSQFLARYPQLRVYEYRSAGTASGRLFLDHNFLGSVFPRPSDTVLRHGRRAFLFDPLDGSETALKYASRVTSEVTGTYVQTVRIPGRAAAGGFYLDNKPARRVYPLAPQARGRIVTTERRTGDYRAALETIEIKSIVPSLDPVDVRPEMVAEAGTARPGQLFAGARRQSRAFFVNPANTAGKVFLPPSSASLRLYARHHLFDPARSIDKRGGRSFLGHFRLGKKPFEADLIVDAQSRRPKIAFGRFCRGYLITNSKRKLHDAIDAAAVSKAYRDRVRVTAKTHRLARVGDRLVVGSAAKVGQWIAVA